MRAVAPGWLPFIKQRITLTQTSGGSKEPTTTVRAGEHGPAVGWRSDPSDPSFGPTTIHFEIPREWNDAQVAQYVLGQLAENDLAHRIAATWARDSKTPELMSHLQWERFKSGMKTVAALAGTYYKAIAGLAPGSGVAVAAWDIEHGDYLGAALGAAFMLPLGKIGKAGVEWTGTVAIKAGDKLIAALPLKVIQRIQKLHPDQQALLQGRLLTAKTKEEAAGIVNRFVNTSFDNHHPLPKFLGGDIDQFTARIPRDVHVEYHAELRKELKKAGFTLTVGSKSGSTAAWYRHLSGNPRSQSEAFNAVLKASGTIDKKHGTNIGDIVIKNLMNDEFTYFP